MKRLLVVLVVAALCALVGEWHGYLRGYDQGKVEWDLHKGATK